MVYVKYPSKLFKHDGYIAPLLCAGLSGINITARSFS